MADVEVKYRGQTIRAMSASGTEVLHTKEKYCDDDITIDYTSPGGGGANLQTKSVSYTPDETGISDTILPDPGYDGMDEVDVTVDPIPDTYVGSAVPQRDSSNLLVTGRLVRAPAGYYASMAGAQVAMGTEGTPTVSKGAVSNHSVDVTPSVTNVAGYINGGTQTGSPVTVSAAELVSGSQTVTVNDTYDVTNLAEMVVNVSGGGGSGELVVDGTFTGAGLHYWAVNAGAKMPKRNFVMWWYADNGSAIPSGGTNWSELAGMIFCPGDVSEYIKTATSSEYDTYEVANSKQWEVTKSDNTTVLTSMAGRNGWSMYYMEQCFNLSGQSNPVVGPNITPRINAYNDHFSIQYNRGNASYKYLNGVIYHIKVYYFGNGDASDFLPYFA